MDFILAIVIFTICITIYYKSIPNIEMKMENRFEDVYLDAKTVASMIISKGSPDDWNTTNVRRIGITQDSNVISGGKVWNFYNLSKENYTGTKMLLGIISDYVVYFTDNRYNIISINKTGIIGSDEVGKSGTTTNISSVDAKNMVRLERILMYNKTPAKMVIYSWR